MATNVAKHVLHGEMLVQQLGQAQHCQCLTQACCQLVNYRMMQQLRCLALMPHQSLLVTKR